jgi:hypothetical protein
MRGVFERNLTRRWARDGGVICLAAWAWFAPFSAAHAACSRQWFSFGRSMPHASSKWTVEKGSTCQDALRITYVSLIGLTIARPASHGVAGVASRYQFGYQPDAGYVGPDSFVLKIEFDDRGRRETTLLTVDVTVR